MVAPGIQIDWTKTEGLREALGTRGDCSNYNFRTVDYTWVCIGNFRGGTTFFMNPSTPVKCGGAPQKIIYLVDDHLRRCGVRDASRVVFASVLKSIFGVPRYARTHPMRRRPCSAASRRARRSSCPATSPRDPAHERLVFIKRSPLADQSGWVDVDKYSLQHVRSPNVFGFRNASNLPTSKTGPQAGSRRPLEATCDGYTTCPLVTGFGKLVLAEFDYDKAPSETFPIAQSKERLSMYLLKRYGLPALYWQGILRGRLWKGDLPISPPAPRAVLTPGDSESRTKDAKREETSLGNALREGGGVADRCEVPSRSQAKKASRPAA